MPRYDTAQLPGTSSNVDGMTHSGLEAEFEWYQLWDDLDMLGMDQDVKMFIKVWFISFNVCIPKLINWCLSDDDWKNKEMNKLMFFKEEVFSVSSQGLPVRDTQVVGLKVLMIGRDILEMSSYL